MLIHVSCSCGEKFLVPMDRMSNVCPACGRVHHRYDEDATTSNAEPRPSKTPGVPPVAGVPPVEDAPSPAPFSFDEAPSIRVSSAPAPEKKSKRGVVLASLAVILFIGFMVASYYGRVSSRITQLDKDLALIPTKQQEAQSEARRTELDRHMQLVVRGPATFQPGAPNEFHIDTRSLADRSLPARLVVRVLDEQKKVLHEEKDIDSPGSYRLSLPRQFGLRTSGSLTLEVEARKKDETIALCWLIKRLDITRPIYSTHLATDKPMYRPGEVVSFRSLTLERFGLQPPREEIRLVYEVRNGMGEKVFESRGSDRMRHREGLYVRGPNGEPVRGVGAGEFAIPAIAAGGEYVLTAREENDLFPPQTRSFLVNTYEKPRLRKELEWSRRSYGPGERALALCKVAVVEGGQPMQNKPVTASIRIDGKSYNAEGTEAEGAVIVGRTDDQGKVQVSFTLPAHIENGSASLSVQFTDGGNFETLVRPIPLVLKKLIVDFYPEGGDRLLAGVPNRIYFAARTTLDRPADLKGRIVDASGKTVAEVKTLASDDAPGVNQGTGSFTFTPLAKQKYELKIDAPLGIQGRLPLPDVVEDGVSLHVAEGVTAGQEPIGVILRNLGRERRLLAALYSRGRLIDSQEVNGGKEEVRLFLKPPADVGGVLRVTVYELRDKAGPKDQMQPLAERLVFRQPPKRLNLTLAPRQSHYVPGERVSLDCSAATEQGQSAPAILMLAVVDQRVLTLADEKTARAMPTHFLLTNEVRRPEDLEHADFLLGNHPKAAEALDLLLGTQGWRRFAEQDPEKFHRQYKDEANRLLATIGQGPVTTNNSAEVEKAYQADLDVKLAKTRSEFDGTEHKLRKDQREARATLDNIWVFCKGTAAFAVVVLVSILIVVVLVSIGSAVSQAEQSGLGLGSLVFFACFMVLVCLASISVLGSNASGKFNEVAMSIGGGVGDASREYKSPQKKGEEPSKDANERFDRPVEIPATSKPSEAQAPDASIPSSVTTDTPKEAAGFPTGPAKPRVASPAFPRNAGESARRRFNEALDAQQRQRVRKDSKQKLSLARGFVEENTSVENKGDRSESFIVREYAHSRAPGKPMLRSDFDETLFWHPVLVLPGGSAGVSFDLCDSITTFQAIAFGHTLDGRLGAVTCLIEARLPFSIEPKMPIEVTSSDQIDLPVTIANDTDSQRAIHVRIEQQGFNLLQGSLQDTFTLDANKRTRQMYRLKPALVEGDARIRIDGRCEPFDSDSIVRTLKVVPDGFPVSGSRSDVLKQSVRHEVLLPEQWFPGTLQCEVQLYPSILGDLQQGLESMLQEPHGCFEQTSSSNYPNLLVLEYLKEKNQASTEVSGRAQQLLERGYSRLVSFECMNPAKLQREGYTWFGGTNPPHEGLTAYGLLQFRDMTRVYDQVDPAMVERTRKFLLSRRDGKGGFQRNQDGLHGFGMVSSELFNAYIVWALTESGKDDDLDTELTAIVEKSRDSKDPYFLALVANSLLNRGRAKDAEPLLRKLVETQKKEGFLDGAQTSITCSGGRNLLVETTALTIMAWLKASPPGQVSDYRAPLQSAVQWLGQQRDGFGGFCSTQATILTLKALLANDASRKAARQGEVVLFVDGRPIATKRFSQNVQEVLTLRLDQPEKYLKPGKNAVQLELSGENEFPYTMAWSYRSAQPPSAEECAVRLQTKLDRASAREAETIRLTVRVENTKPKEQGMTVAIIGLPAGLTLPEDMKQLKELARPREGGTLPGPIDAWELRGRELILYWQALTPEQKVKIDLDLVCRVPGEYHGPASRAYLYYDADLKWWDKPLEVAIQPAEEP